MKKGPSRSRQSEIGGPCFRPFRPGLGWVQSYQNAIEAWPSPALAGRPASAAGFRTRASRCARPAIPHCRNEGRRLGPAASGRRGAFRDQPQRRPLVRPARHVGIGKNLRDPAQPWGSGLHGPKLNTKQPTGPLRPGGSPPRQVEFTRSARQSPRQPVYLACRPHKKPISGKPGIGAHSASFNFANSLICTTESRHRHA